MNIGLCITGSFCTYEKILEITDKIVKEGHKVIPIVSDAVKNMDTRFGKAKDFIEKIEAVTGNEVVSTVVQAEPLGPQNAIDVLAVAPCTGNTLAKLSCGISDDAVTMSCKAHMRNYKPLVIAISTNDALGLNMKNIATLMNEKNVYFVPFGQDNPEKKPKSLIADYDLLLDTILIAEKGKQLQPIIFAKNYLL